MIYLAIYLVIGIMCGLWTIQMINNNPTSAKELSMNKSSVFFIILFIWVIIFPIAFYRAYMKA